MVQYTEPCVAVSRSITPITTSMPALRAAAHSRSVSGPGTSIDASRARCRAPPVRLAPAAAKTGSPAARTGKARHHGAGFCGLHNELAGLVTVACTSR
jgi:hypothetical protein